MTSSDHALAEPMLQQTVSRGARPSGKALTVAFLIVGLGFAAFVTMQEPAQETAVDLAALSVPGAAAAVPRAKSTWAMSPSQPRVQQFPQPASAWPQFKQLWQPVMQPVRQFSGMLPARMWPAKASEGEEAPVAEESETADEGDEDAGEGGTVKGTMLRWNTQRGFGFIKPDAGGEDIFCHISALVDGEDSINDGDPVTYVIEFDDRSGQDRATGVKYAGDQVRGRVNGTMLRWNTEKGFGFIKPGDGGKDVFCHVSALTRGEGSVNEGDEVTYIMQEARGQTRAARVRLASDIPEPPQERPQRKPQQRGEGKGKGKGKRDRAPREPVDNTNYEKFNPEEIAHLDGVSPFAALANVAPKEKTPA